MVILCYPAIDILQSISRLMNTVTDAEHQMAARKLREIYATYTDAEDLINIGAFSPGANKRIDGSVALINRIQEFLVQPVRQLSPFDQTVKQLLSITQAWDQMLGTGKPQQITGPKTIAK
jgi:flagellum-specific ATP synthase